MLGWHVFIFRLRPGQAPASASEHWNISLASWCEDVRGLDWIDQMVKAGQAEFHGGTGYPDCYTARAGVVLARIAEGPPRPKGPPVIGDGYALPGGHVWRLKVDFAEIERCPEEEVLSIIVWDLS